jgi:glycosyltransferase involved in cell wall biosynthesis
MGALIGLAIIAKNEEENLPHLLGSIDRAFDRVVLLDTGSTDNTLEVFAAWAKNQPGLTFSTATWEWTNDFSDARNAADRLLLFGMASEGADRNVNRPLVDWRSWADCDDVIVGAGSLRDIAENADPRVTAFFASYDYAQDPQTGQCVIKLPRERLIRSEYPIGWQGRVHEATPISGGMVTTIPEEVVHWKHRKQQTTEEAAGESNERNLAILHKWNDDEPNNPRVVGYLGTEHAVRGELDKAVMYYHQYLRECNSQWDQERAQIRRKLSVALLIQDRSDEALQVTLDAVADVPSWPDSYLTLAEMALLREEYSKCEFWAKRVLELGHPETVLITNPMDYDLTPRRLLALAYGRSGRIDEAVELGTQVAMAQPGDQGFIAELHQWRTTAKRERTADTYVMASEQLVGHDEQEKARTLLENCVPHFAYEHPKIVAERSRVRERLLWANNPGAYADHYETGGSKPEDFIPDDQVDALCEYLPRTNFLLEGIKEQIDGA